MIPSKTLMGFLFGILGLTLCLSACRSTPPVGFYTLNSQTDFKVPPGNEIQFKNLSVGIGSVVLPDYLDRPQMVTFKGPHRLHLSEFHRWACRLDGEIARAMGKNVSMLLGTSNVAIFPWDQSKSPDFKVDLTFYHFEGTLGESFHIQGVWTLTQKKNKNAISTFQFDQKIPISGSTYEDLAAASSRGLWSLGQEISQRIVHAATMSTHND